jgi:hypothetical protein
MKTDSQQIGRGSLQRFTVLLNNGTRQTFEGTAMEQAFGRLAIWNATRLVIVLRASDYKSVSGPVGAWPA